MAHDMLKRSTWIRSKTPVVPPFPLHVSKKLGTGGFFLIFGNSDRHKTSKLYVYKNFRDGWF
jgi:hypothetical protein